MGSPMVRLVPMIRGHSAVVDSVGAVSVCVSSLGGPGSETTKRQQLWSELMIEILKSGGHSKEAREKINVVQEASMYWPTNSCPC